MVNHNNNDKDKNKKSLSDYSPKTQESIDKIIKDMCDENQSEDLEQDIIALFEDILKFFSGRSEDFINFDSLSPEQKKELYVQIKAVIEILKKLKSGPDKQEAIQLLSKGMIATFSKGANKRPAVENLTAEDQRRLKETFARITIQQVHDQKIQAQKEVNHKATIEEIKNKAVNFATKIEKEKVEKKIGAFSRGR